MGGKRETDFYINTMLKWQINIKISFEVLEMKLQHLVNRKNTYIKSKL